MTPQDFLIDYIESRKGPIGDTIDRKLSIDYLAENLIDSMELVSLIIAIEEKFRIRLESEHMQSDEFLTIGGLAHIITKLCSHTEAN